MSRTTGQLICSSVMPGDFQIQQEPVVKPDPIRVAALDMIAAVRSIWHMPMLPRDRKRLDDAAYRLSEALKTAEKKVDNPGN